MSERLLSTIEWTPRHEDAANTIGNSALQLMTHRYGDGQPAGAGGYIRRLWYHQLPHARAVGEKAGELCDRMGLSRTERELAKVAGYAHDVVQLKGTATNELGSGAWLTHALSIYDMDEFRDPSMKAVIGTIPMFESGILTHQKAHELPDGPNSKMIKSVAAADLSGLYTPDGPHESHTLYAELQGKQPGEEVSLEGVAAFQRGQIALLEGYEYPLREANVFATHRKEVIEHQTKMQRTMEAGNFDSFSEILAADEQFRLRHAA